jgi:DNA (cytosine-5)-methyltransferase 1
MTKKRTKALATRKKNQDVVCVDLFCGAGGLTHGLIEAGVRVVAGVDFDQNCEHPYSANHSEAKFYKRDVAKLSPAEVNSWFGNAKIKVLAGCAPCQPFSTYAQRYETVGTERWGLLNHFARLTKEIRPDIVTMENVPTVTRHDVFDNFVAALKKQGYHVWYSVIDSAEYGLPQRRRRTVLLASLRGSIELRAPDSSRPQTVRDALNGLPSIRHGKGHKDDPLHRAATLSPLNLKRIKASKPGGIWRDWPKHLVADCHRKMKWDEPSPTLTTQFFGFGNGRFGHPTQNRALSLREGATLQGFPRNYSFVKDGEQIEFRTLGRLIGNAVPVQLGRVIGESIIRHVGQYPMRRMNQGRGRNGRKRSTVGYGS